MDRQNLKASIQHPQQLTGSPEHIDSPRGTMNSMQASKLRQAIPAVELSSEEIARRASERRITPGMLVIEPNSGEPAALRNGEDIGHRLKPRRIEESLLGRGIVVNGAKLGACKACQRGPVSTIRIPSRVFF